MPRSPGAAEVIAFSVHSHPSSDQHEATAGSDCNRHMGVTILRQSWEFRCPPTGLIAAINVLYQLSQARSRCQGRRAN